MLTEYEVSSMLSKLGVDFINTNGYFKCKCPVCGDSKKSRNIRRLKISQYHDTWMCYCWNGGCDVQGINIFSLYSDITGISYLQAKKELIEPVYDSRIVKKKMSSSKETLQADDTKTVEILDLDIDKDCLKVSSIPNSRIEERFHKALLSFIKERKIPIECFVAISGRYQGRIIIPIYIKGKLVYFQGRAISDSIENKYLNPYVEKGHIILNIDKFNVDMSIIVTEGSIDAYMVDYNQGTTSLGAVISDDLLEILLDHTDKDVIVAFDNPDIDKSGYTTIMKMIKDSKYGKRVKYFLMPYKDIKDLNDLKVKKGIENIYQFVLDHSHSHFYISTIYKLS
jgi:hypothetical protein